MSGATAIRRAIARHRALQVFVKTAPAQRVIQAVRGARAVRETRSFLLREIVLRSGVASYRLHSGQAVSLRHGTRDVEILNEIFGGTGGRHAYEAPDALKPLLNRPLMVADLGGNIGLFGLYAFATWPVHHLTSYEPEPANARILEEVIAANLRASDWTLVQAAVSNRSGNARFATGLFADARFAADTEVGVDVPLLDIFDSLGDVDLLKIDIEGAEWPILRDPRMRDLSADVVAIEWHASGSGGEDPHADATAALVGHGYWLAEDRVADHGQNGIIWAARNRPRDGASAS